MINFSIATKDLIKSSQNSLITIPNLTIIAQEQSCCDSFDLVTDNTDDYVEVYKLTANGSSVQILLEGPEEQEKYQVLVSYTNQGMDHIL